MKKNKSLGQFYVLSTVSVPRKQSEHYKEMPLQKNTEFIEFICNKINERPQILEEMADGVTINNFKIKKEKKDIYNELLKKLKDHKKKTGDNVSLSQLYMKFYDEFSKI